MNGEGGGHEVGQRTPDLRKERDRGGVGVEGGWAPRKGRVQESPRHALMSHTLYTNFKILNKQNIFWI